MARTKSQKLERAALQQAQDFAPLTTTTTIISQQQRGGETAPTAISELYTVTPGRPCSTAVHANGVSERVHGQNFDVVHIRYARGPLPRLNLFLTQFFLLQLWPAWFETFPEPRGLRVC